MQKNLMKAKLEEGKVVLGGGARTPYPGVIEAMGYAGVDWVLIDGEHGSMSYETAEVMCMYAYAVGVTPIMRVHELSESLITRALDLGALGVLVPHVKTAADARRAADAAFYQPVGTRGVGPMRGARFGAVALTDYFAHANRETVVMVMIEDAEAIENIDAIAAAEGIHILHIGTADLSQSMGVPGQTDHPTIQAAVREVAAAAQKHGKWVGCQARNRKRITELTAAGFHSLTVGNDMAVLRAAFAELVGAKES